jgi:AcrR family transcriptional regulator
MQMHDSRAPAHGPRPGGRSARVREAVLQATLDTLVSDGYAAVTVTSVADAAGVHSSTVYRRWGGRAQLIADAVRQMSESAVPTPDTGTLAGDLTVLIRQVVQLLTNPPTLAVVRSLAAVPPDLDDEFAATRTRFWQARFDSGAAIVERAVSRGELPGGVEATQVFEMLVGPPYLRALLTGAPLDAKFIRVTVRRVIEAFAVSV